MESLKRYINSLRLDAEFWQKKYEQDCASSDPVYRQVANENKEKARLLIEIINRLSQVESEMVQERKDLLRLFWSRTSDACPLECEQHEQQLMAWQKWINASQAPQPSKFLPTPIPEGDNPYRLA